MATNEQLDGYAAVMLLVTTAFIMLLFYMANAHVKIVHDQTWSMLMAAVSIFVAVMWNTVVSFISKTILGDVFGLELGGEDTPPTVAACLGAFVHITFCWIFVSILLHCFKDSILRLKGYGTIGGHIMGFATIGFWGLVMQRDPFKESAWWIFPGVWAMYMVVMSTFLSWFHCIGKCAAAKESMSKEDLDRWHDQQMDTGTDFFCLGQAYIITTWVKYLITGELSPAMEDPEGAKEDWQLWVFGAVTFVFALLSAVFAILSHKLGHPTWCDFAGTIASTVASMCLLDVWGWRVLPKFPDMALLGHLSMAFQLTLIAIGLILVISILHHCTGNVARRGLRGVFTGMGLAVGSSWEKTFDAGVDRLEVFGLNEAKKTLITICLVVIVFPAWMVYILPKADDELKKEIKTSPPVWAICCDHNPCDEDEENDWLYEEGEDGDEE